MSGRGPCGLGVASSVSNDGRGLKQDSISWVPRGWDASSVSNDGRGLKQRISVGLLSKRPRFVRQQ